MHTSVLNSHVHMHTPNLTKKSSGVRVFHYISWAEKSTHNYRQNSGSLVLSQLIIWELEPNITDIFIWTDVKDHFQFCERLLGLQLPSPVLQPSFRRYYWKKSISVYTDLMTSEFWSSQRKQKKGLGSIGGWIVSPKKHVEALSSSTSECELILEWAIAEVIS